MIMVIFMIMNVYDYDDYHDYLKVSWYIIWMIMNDYDDIYIYGTKKGIKGTPMIYVPYNYHIR